MDPVQKALWFVESHSRDPITLEDVAKACNVSPFHLTRAFAATMGVSLMRYVRGRRLSEAARQLALGAEEILGIALDAGYGSHEAFTRAFRDQYSNPGVTCKSIWEQAKPLPLSCFRRNWKFRAPALAQFSSLEENVREKNAMESSKRKLGFPRHA